MLQIRRAFGGSLLAAFLLTVAAPWSAAPAPDPQPQDQPADASTSADLAWPRIIEEGGTTFTVFQPQIDKFDSGVLEARAAVQVETHQDDHTTTTFGVIWIKANTAIDKENRLVQLDDIQIVKANFPTAGDKVNEYLDVFRNHTEGTRTISLDRVEANLAITNAGAKGNAVPIKNDPPRVFFRSAPAVLVLIDGDPALRPVDGSPGVDRVINTRTLILRSGGTFFMPIADRWVSSAAATGPWQIVPGVPAPVQAIRDAIANDQEQTQVDLMEETNDDVKGILAEGRSPEIIVSTVPAELIVTQGPPQMKPVGGTQLLYVTNTTGDILFDLKAQDFYVPLTGRWFRSKSLDGPWQFVAGDQLPPDFAKIPTTEPKSTVLATVPGTPASQEAQIANSIPQTAEINRAEATFQSNFDGDPQFQPVQDTSLQWAINSPTPVIRVNPTTFFAVQGGVWFTAGSPMGPWTVATVVPPVIYTIPVASPIHYCTFVRVFRFNPTTVWVGYTPGYLGTCFSPWGTVVFGTGWFHRPWIGRFWFGRPWTWGFGAGFWWSRRSGWGWGFGWGGVRPVFNPWWGPFWGWRPRPPIYRPPMFPGRPVHLPGRVGRPNWNNVNVYNRAGRPRPGVRPAVVRPAPLPARPGPGARPATRPGPGGTSPGTRPAPGTRPG
ncbi:MAG TPA: hypothetical protein VKG23_08055, partial [Thermoanaerobaculia bacterium]|nr:hypothetical protein [Thermoanaerobaculia bacterium]